MSAEILVYLTNHCKTRLALGEFALSQDKLLQLAIAKGISREKLSKMQKSEKLALESKWVGERFTLSEDNRIYFQVVLMKLMKVI